MKYKCTEEPRITSYAAIDPDGKPGTIIIDHDSDISPEKQLEKAYAEGWRRALAIFE